MKLETAENEEVEVRAAGDASAHVSRDDGPVLRAATDDLSVWLSVRRFKKVGCIAMAAAFCASLDGYRTESPESTLVPVDVVC
jgi:hypothetical protein